MADSFRRVSLQAARRIFAGNMRQPGLAREAGFLTARPSAGNHQYEVGIGVGVESLKVPGQARETVPAFELSIAFYSVQVTEMVNGS